MSAAPKPAKPPSRVTVTWAQDQQFEARRPGGPAVLLDGRGGAGPSPVDGLLGSLASCTAIDVVEILAKRRTPVEALEVDVTGERATGVPARVTRILLRFRVRGAGIDRMQVERAVELSLTKYCSVRATLDPGMPVDWEVEVG